MNFRMAMSLLALISALAVASASASTFSVDSTGDAVDVAPGDGVCLSMDGNCTLRAAVMEANASAGADIVDLTAIDDPLQPITLTLEGVDETFVPTPQGEAACAAVLEADASIGDLDITGDLTIQGAGAGLTVIRWDARNLVVPAVGDRIFHIQSEPGVPLTRVAVADLMIANGGVGVAADLDPANPYNCEVSGASGARQAWQFRRFGGGIAVGSGAAVVLFDEALHGAGNVEPDRSGADDGDVDPRADVGVVELERVAVVGNRSGSDGGGLDATAPTTIADSVFSDNQAEGNGGGLHIGAESTVSGTLIGDAATDVAYPSGPVSVTVLGPNVAASGGGAFATGLHTSSIIRSAVNLNEATAGGAIATRLLARMTVSDTTISGNSASAEGGGITTNGIVTLRNATVANNRTTGGAAGVGGGVNAFDRGVYLFANTLFSNNVVVGTGTTATRDASCGCTGVPTRCPAGSLVTLGNNLNDEATDSCALSAASSDKLNADPLLAALGANGGLTETHRLPSTASGDAATSPAIDAASNIRCTNSDQRKSLRPQDGNDNGTFDCDIGAFELLLPGEDLNIGGVTVPDRVDRGETVEMQITVRNDYADTVVPAATYAATVAPASGLAIVNAATTAGTCVVVSVSNATCALGDLAAGAVATVTLTLAANVQGTYSVESKVANDPSFVDLVTGNNSVTSRIVVIGSSDVELSVNVDQTNVRVEDDITFDFLISNGGDDDAQNVRLGVEIPASVLFFSASYDPAHACAWQARRFLCEMDELDAGDSTTFRLIVTAAATGDFVFEGDVVADQDDPDPDNNSISTAVTILERPSSGGGGGGCAYHPGGPFDPTLPGFLLALALMLLWRRRASP